MSLYFGPPWLLKPSHEQYGEILLDVWNPELAGQQFTEGLAQAEQALE